MILIFFRKFQNIFKISRTIRLWPSESGVSGSRSEILFFSLTSKMFYSMVLLYFEQLCFHISSQSHLLIDIGTKHQNRVFGPVVFCILCISRMKSGFLENVVLWFLWFERVEQVYRTTVRKQSSKCWYQHKTYNSNLSIFQIVPFRLLTNFQKQGKPFRNYNL